jgi:hypothetical protein
MVSKMTLGKIFVSYSWLDKQFVRRLVARLEKSGYLIWLDEKELAPGDRLSSKLAEAIEGSKVIIIVISENSITSNWLKFELELATRRMVEERVRLIPVIKGDVTVPDQLKGLVYADFRPGSRAGYKKLLSAIEDEIPQALENSSFWTQVQHLLAEVFDGKTTVFVLSKSGKKSIDYDVVQIRDLPGFEEELSIPYAIIPSDNFLDYVHGSGVLKREYKIDHENIAEPYFLMVYEGLYNQEHLNTDKGTIRISELDSPYLRLAQYEVWLDMSGLKTMEDRRRAVIKVKSFIREHAIANKSKFGSLLR